jgi:hypothetical protein
VPQVGSGSDRETLQQHKIRKLEEDVRRLRLTLRSALPHIPTHLRAHPERVLEETWHA